MLILCLRLIIIAYLLCYAIAKNSELLTKIICKSPEYIYCSESNSCVRKDCALQKVDECPANTNYCPYTDECLPVCPQTRSKRFEEIRNNKLCTNVINVNVVSHIIGSENKSNNNSNNKTKIAQQINNNNQVLIKNKSTNSYARPNSVNINDYVLNYDRNKVYVLEVKLVIQKDYSEFVSNSLKETRIHLLAQISTYFNVSRFVKDFSIERGSVIIRFKIPTSKQKIVEDYVSGAKNLTLTDISGNKYLVKNISAKYLDANNNEVENKLITVRNSLLSLKQHSNSKTISSNEELTDISKTTSQEVSTVSSDLSSNIESEPEVTSSSPINTQNEIQVATTLRQYLTSGTTDTASRIQTNSEIESKPVSQPLQDVTEQEESSSQDRRSPNFTDDTKITSALPKDVTPISSDLSSDAQSITEQQLVTATSIQNEKTSKKSGNSSPEKQIYIITVLQETTIVTNDIATDNALSTTIESGITTEAPQRITPSLPNNTPSEIPLTTASESQVTTNSLPEVTPTISSQVTTEIQELVTVTSQQEIPVNTAIDAKTTPPSDAPTDMAATTEGKPKTLSTLPPQEITSKSNDISSNAPISTENMSQVTTALPDNSPAVPSDVTASIPTNIEGDSKVTTLQDITTSSANEVLTTKSTITEPDSTKEVTLVTDASNIPISTGMATTSVTQEVTPSVSVTSNLPTEVTITNDVTSNTPLNTEAESKVTTLPEVTTSSSNDLLTTKSRTTDQDSKITPTTQDLPTAGEESSIKPINTGTDSIVTASVTQEITPNTPVNTAKEISDTTNLPQELTSDVSSNAQITTEKSTKVMTNTPQDITPEISENVVTTVVTVATNSPQEITSVANTQENPISSEQMPNSISSDIPISTVKVTTQEVTVATTEQEITKTTEKVITTEIVSSAEQTTKSPLTKAILITTLKPEVQDDKPTTKERVSLSVKIETDFVTVVGNGIANENTFAAHIKPQLATLLRVPFASIVNVTARKGSIVIRFDLIPVSNQEFSVNLESIKAAKQEFERKIIETNQYIRDKSGNNHKLCLLITNNIGSKNNTHIICCQTPANASLLTSDGYLILVIAIIAIITTIMMVLVTAYTVRWFVINKYKRKTRPDYNPKKFVSTVKPITINGRMNTMEVNASNTRRILEGLKTRDSDKSYDSGVWINGSGVGGGVQDFMANGAAKQVPEPHTYCPPDDAAISGTPQIPPEVLDKLRTQWKINDDKLFR